ncbi:MAG TPA: sigma-70 family RNA polymerase sigma factor [Myxococcota bacterium]|nr:sigma-70 family RNA polymerase sigma factor [Myxococcota bacterium]
MARLQEGDERALEQLMQRYQAPLYGFLSRRVGSAADDVFQETWIRIVRARERFDLERRFAAWLYQIANNLCRDRYRRVGAMRRAVDSFRSEDEALREPSVEPELADRDVMRERVLALPDRLREVLVLRYYEDLGEEEMSRALGVPRGTIKSRLHAAVKALRVSIEREGDDSGARGIANPSGVKKS